MELPFFFINVKAGRTLIIYLNSYSRPRHTLDYNSVYLLLALTLSPGSIELGYIWSFNWSIMYQSDYACYHSYLLWTLRWAGILGRVQLVCVSRNGVNKHSMCGHVLWFHRTRFWIEFGGPDWRDHYSTRQLYILEGTWVSNNGWPIMWLSTLRTAAMTAI